MENVKEVNEAIEVKAEATPYEKPKKLDKIKAVPAKVGGVIKRHAKGFAAGVASTAALAAAGAAIAVKLRDGAIEMPLDLEGGEDLPFESGSEEV